DSGNQPVLFDMQVRGQRVKALAEASKNGYLYILNRETGQPVHPIKEMPVPTQSARAGDQPWPTQPMPFTAKGEPRKPGAAVVPSPRSVRRPACAPGRGPSPATDGRAPSAPPAASRLSAAAATSPDISSRTTPRPAICSGSSTPAPASTHRPPRTSSTARSSL